MLNTDYMKLCIRHDTRYSCYKGSYLRTCLICLFLQEVPYATRMCLFFFSRKIISFSEILWLYPQSHALSHNAAITLCNTTFFNMKTAVFSLPWEVSLVSPEPVACLHWSISDTHTLYSTSTARLMKGDVSESVSLICVMLCNMAQTWMQTA